MWHGAVLESTVAIITEARERATESTSPNIILATPLCKKPLFVNIIAM